MTAHLLFEFQSRLLAADSGEASLEAIAWRRKMVPVVPALLAILLPALAASTLPLGHGAGAAVEVSETVAVAPEPPPPLLLKHLSKVDAIAANRLIPFSTLGNIPAQPFRFTGSKTDRARALTCLTAAVYYEAASESQSGQQAVAQVVLNRVRDTSFPASVCGVVFEGSALPTGCQFTFTCDGSLMRTPDRRGWSEAQAIADAALSGFVFSPVGLSTHYHADYVVPYWATSLAKDAQIGTHIFYTWPQSWGSSNALGQHYTGHEADPAVLRTAALMAHGILPPPQQAMPDPDIEVTADPQVELVGIVSLLARAPSANPDPYEANARYYFAGVSNDSAVRLLRASSGGAPDASLLKIALNDFSSNGGFAAFFESQRPFYRDAVNAAQRDANAAAAAWQRYTGIPIGKRSVSVAVGFTDASSVCLARNVAASDVWFRPAPGGSATAADIFVNSGLSRGVLAGDATSLTPSLEEQIVRAVFARAAALSLGEAAGDQAVRRESERGYNLVPELADRLRQYESNRTRYPTLVDFLPVLVADLPATDSAPRPASGCSGPAAS